MMGFESGAIAPRLFDFEGCLVIVLNAAADLVGEALVLAFIDFIGDLSVRFLACLSPWDFALFLGEDSAIFLVLLRVCIGLSSRFSFDLEVR